MARSRDLRPGHSRRAQYGIFTAYVIAVGGVIIGVIALGVSLYNPGAFGFLRGAANEIGAPAGEASNATRRSGAGLVSAINAWFDTGHRNLELTHEIAGARATAISVRVGVRHSCAIRRNQSIRSNGVTPGPGANSAASAGSACASSRSA